jgi:hypothetical protein
MLITDGKLEAAEELSPDNRQKQYLVDINDLPAALQKRYYARLKAESPIPALIAETKRLKPLDQYSAHEREQIAFWTAIIEEWMQHRQGFDRVTDADPLFVSALKLRYKDLDISVDILYRRYAAYKNGDLDGLIDKRGGWNRGHSSIPDAIWNYFLYAYLDDKRPPISQCYELCRQWTREYSPELAAEIPSEQSFRRRAAKIEKAVVTMARYGPKAFDDRAAPYITRLYDELQANDYWIADNHTWDIMTVADNGTEVVHRLYITGFIDARSGVIVGWNITDNPCAASTILALRHAIMRFGIPWKIYVDNGMEFLTYDVGGRGHRAKAGQDWIKNPPPIFTRLGIEMVNAIVRNAKAKPIERTFGTLKNTISRCFETFTGGNIIEKPESLKYTLKKGNIPTDSRLREVVADMIDGIYNVGAYGGAMKADHGKARIDVWNESIAEAGQRIAAKDDLALMLMRSSRPQKVRRNGVYITVCGEKLDYWDADTWTMLDQEVYVRYDPEDLSSVRVYDAVSDRYITTLPMALSTTLLFNAESEDVAVAMEDVRRVKKAVKQRMKDYKTALPAAQRIDILDMQVRRAHAGKEGFIIQPSKLIIPVYANEEPLRKVSGGSAEGVLIDMAKMNQAAARRKNKD